MEAYKALLEQGKNARGVTFLSKEEQKVAHDLFLLTTKPVLYVANVDEASAKTGNEYSKKVEEIAKKEGAECMVIAAKKEGIKNKMIIQVHDELNFSVYPEEKEKVEQIVVEEMQNAYQLDVPLVADAGWGNNWLEAH